MQRRELASVRPLRERKPLSAYNLFRREDKPDLYCAVPKDRALPGFLHGHHWAFVGEVTEATAPPGFWKDQARSGVRLNGFYLFMAYAMWRMPSPSHQRAARSPAREVCAA